jgi:hypothetical protein
MLTSRLNKINWNLNLNNNLSSNLNFWNNYLNCNSYTFLSQIIVSEFLFFIFWYQNVSNLIYAWRDRNVHFTFKQALYSSSRACATTSSKSRKKSEDDAQSTRSENLWLSEELDHQNSCLIRDLRFTARAEEDQSHVSRFDRNHFFSVDLQVWLSESEKRTDRDDESLREESECDD